jgi:RHS repeat-associated protein
MSNPLVADVKSSTTGYSGISLLESAHDLNSAIQSGDWASVAMGSVGTALDALSMAMDPFGAILAAGVGWLMEHIGPLKSALDALAGNPDQIKANSETWANIAKELGSVGEDLVSMANNDTASWTGKAGDAYRQRAADLSALLGSAKEGSEGASSGVKTAGEVVAAVRSLVRDIIAELVGHMISWALQVVFTLGIGLAWVVPEVVAAVAKTASQIASITTKLTKALKALVPLLKKAGDLFADAAKALKNIKPGKAAPTPKPKDLPSGPKGGGTPKGGDGSTTPSGGKADTPPPPKTDPPPAPKGDGSTTPSGAGDTPPPPKADPPPPPKADPPPAAKADPPPAPKADPPPAPKTDGTTPSGSRGLDGPGLGKDSPPPLKDQEPNPRSQDNLRCENDPIDVSSGQMVMSEIDAEFLGTLPLVVERTHFSARQAGRWFGPSWVSTVDQRLAVDDSGLTFAAADGTIQKYAHPVAGTWITSDQGPVRSLTRADDGGYLMEDTELARVLYFAPGTSVLPLTSVTDRGGNRLEFVHDEHGVPTEIRHSGGYTVRLETTDGLVTATRSVAADGTEVELMRYGYTAGNLTEVTNASGQAFRYTYDAAGRIVSWTDRNGEWYRYTYDHSGRCVRTEGAGGFFTGTMEYDTVNRVTYSTDSLGHRTEFHLNEAGQVIKEVDPLGNTIVNEWDRHDRLLRQSDPLGRTTAYTYDDGGNVATVTRPDGAEIGFERNQFGKPLMMVEAPGVVTRWEYDESGNLTAMNDPAGTVSRYTYDDRGNVSTVTDAFGNTLSIESDASGLPVAATDPLGGVTRYERDRFGRISAITDPLGAVERFGYTVDGQLAWHRHADGGLEQWVFDGEGNSRSHTSPAAAVTRAEVTHFDLPAAEVRPDGTRVEFAYDTRLRLTAVTNEQGLVWRYEYDAAGNLVRETDFAGVAADYRYDGAGQLVARTNAGETTTFRYDLVGNMVEHTCGPVTTRYTYSTAGHLLEADDGHSRVSFQRDAGGRITAETVNGRTVESGYDAAGRRVRRRTPSGAESVWEYDALGQPTAVHTAGRTMRFEHDGAGHEVRRALDSGTEISQAWTPNDQLRSQTITSAAGQLSQQRSYAYRPDGALTGVQDRLTGPRTFALDQRGRVTGVQASRWSERYAYDVAGNVTEAVWPATTDQDTLGHRSFAGTVIQTAGRTRFTHDDRGRLVVRDSDGGGTWRYTWGQQDRLVGLSTPDGTQWRYSYDALGRRIGKERLGADGTSVAERVEFTWDDQVLVEQARTDERGTRVTVWDYEPDGFRPLIQRERLLRSPQEWIDEQFYAIVADPAGAPTELVNDQGGIAWFSRTSLWGHAVESTSTAADTPLRFSGQYFDAESGLHYNYFRYYDPATGRYASPDPVGLAGGPNPHAYVENPHAWVDPLGLAPQSCTAGTSGQSAGTKRGANGKPKLSVNTQVPNKVVTAQSPGGRTYQQMSPGGKYAGKSRRDGAGYNNPSHDHGNMLPHWKDAATSPIPPGLKGKPLKDHLMDPGRHFQTHSPGGTNTGVITGHGNGVLGHDPSASTHWNHHGGKEQPRTDNLAHNKQTDTYHGIEDRNASNASGSKEERYDSPRPDDGSHRAYWDRNDPDFPNQGGPWHSWEEVPGSASSGGSPLTPVPDTPPAKRPRLGSSDVDMDD